MPFPLNWRLSAAELTAMIGDSGAGIVFTDEAAAPAVEQAEAEVPGLHTVVALHEHGRWPSLAHWKEPVGADPAAPVQADDIAFQLYTSGTTGPPKGAMFANGTNLRVLLDDISVAWGFTPDDVSLVCMPLFHMGGLAWALAGMARGTRQVIVRDFAPGPVLQTMADEGVTLAFCVPTMLSALSAAPPPGAEPDRRAAGEAGAGAEAPAARARCARWSTPVPRSAPPACARPRTRWADFVHIYGLTEATGAFAQLSAAEHTDPGHPEWLRSAGRPYPWVEVRAVSPQTGPRRAHRAGG